MIQLLFTGAQRDQTVYAPIGSAGQKSTEAHEKLTGMNRKVYFAITIHWVPTPSWKLGFRNSKVFCLFQVIDLLVNLLQCPLGDGEEESHVIRIFKEAYDVLHAYMIGKSRKNALYMAKYIDFFQTQFTQKVQSFILVFYNTIHSLTKSFDLTS